MSYNLLESEFRSFNESSKGRGSYLPKRVNSRNRIVYGVGAFLVGVTLALSPDSGPAQASNLNQTVEGSVSGTDANGDDITKPQTEQPTGDAAIAPELTGTDGQPKTDPEPQLSSDVQIPQESLPAAETPQWTLLNKYGRVTARTPEGNLVGFIEPAILPVIDTSPYPDRSIRIVSRVSVSRVSPSNNAPGGLTIGNGSDRRVVFYGVEQKVGGGFFGYEFVAGQETDLGKISDLENSGNPFSWTSDVILSPGGGRLDVGVVQGLVDDPQIGQRTTLNLPAALQGVKKVLASGAMSGKGGSSTVVGTDVYIQNR